MRINTHLLDQMQRCIMKMEYACKIRFNNRNLLCIFTNFAILMIIV